MQNDNGRLNFGARIDNSQLRTDAQESKRVLNGIGTTAKHEGYEIDKAMGKIGSSIAAVFAVSKLKDFAKQVAVVRGEFQQLEIAFQTMLGSKAEADKLMSQLIQTAVITPFNMSDVANAAKLLLAYGVEADKVNETLIRLGDIAAGLSIPINDLAYLYGTTMVQGRMYTQDLNQFLGRGIPLAEELAKQFGVTKNKVKSLVEEGKVGFPEVEKAIISLTSEGGKFGGLMEAQSKSITGQISNIEDQIEQMFNEIGKSSEGAIGTALNGVSSIIGHWKEIGKVILIAVTAYGTYKAALIAMNVIQKISNTLTAEAALQQRLAAMSGIALSQAEAIAAARTTLLTAAWNGLKVAIMSNPIGLILGVLAGAATAIGLFSSETSEAATMSEKFGESAAKEISRLKTLATTYNGLTEGTSTHKKVLEELNGILEEYGIAQIKEGDNIDTVNAKREQAIELIKREAIERQRANNLDQGEQDYQKGISDAQSEMAKQFESAMTVNSVGWVSANDEIRKNAKSIQAIIGDAVQENISEIAGKTGDEYQKGLDKIYATIQQKMRIIGISEKTISEQWVTDDLFNHQHIIQNFIDKLQNLTEEHNRYNDAVNKSADADRQAAEDTMTFSDRVAATQRSLRGATNDVHTLYKNIQNLMSKYKYNTLGFTVTFNAKVPKWMSNMKLPELQRLAANFSALGDQAAKVKKGGLNVNGKWYTTQQLLQRGADYAQAAENRQNEAEKKQRDLEASKKESKRKNEQATRKSEEERKRIADQTADRNKAIQKYKENVIEQNKQAELDIAQQQIENMEDGYEKQRKQIEIHYERLIEENKKREKQMVDAIADNKVNEWLNANPKATKQQQVNYRKSLTDLNSKNHLTLSDLSAEQQEALAAYEEIANKIKKKELEALYGTGQQAMLDYLSKYGSFQEQKYAIASEYAEKIKEVQRSSDTEEQKAWKIKGLQAEQKREEQTIETNAIMSKIDWYQVFGNVGGIMKNTLAPLLEELKSFTKTDKFQSLEVDQQKQIVDAMEKIRSQVGNTADLGWKDLARDITDYQTALQDASQATHAYEKLQAEYAPKIKEAQEKLDKAKRSNDQKGIDEASTELNGFVQILSEGGDKVTQANKKVTSSGQQLAQTTKGVTQPIDDIHNFLQTTGLSELQSLWDSFNQIKGAVNGIKALKEAANGAKEISEGTKETADALGDAGKVVVDSLSEGLSKAGFIGQIIAAVLKILDVLKGGVGPMISSVVDSILGAVADILKNILSGEFLKQIFSSLIKGVGNIINSIIGSLGHLLSFGALSGNMGDWFTGSNAKKVSETTERLTNQNEALQHSIDKLKDSIDKSYGGKAISDYKEAKKAQELKNENLRNILTTQQGYHGSHHSNAYYWNMSDDFTKMVNDLLGTALRGSKWSDWAQLTAEQMEKIRTYLPQVWSSMLEQGEYDKSEYFEQYADEAGKLKELTDQIRENLLNTSFESLRDSFIDSLMDMSKSAEDFTDNFSEMMQKALLRAAISNKFDKQIKAWYEQITDDMQDEDGNYKELTEEQINSYKSQWDAITKQMIAERDRIANITGYTGDTDSGREASSKGIASASQESIDELNGRMTAIQGHTYNINENTKMLLQSTNLILRSVQNIERHTEDIPDRLSTMESNIKSVKDTVNDIALKGIKIKA